jgi:rod shape-determining protein MreC
VLRPFEIAANRVARPFEDAYGWTADIFHAKSENEKLRQEVKELRQRAIQASAAVEERNALRGLLKVNRSPAYEDLARTAVTAEVLSNPVSQFDQTMVIAAGRNEGIHVYDAVITDRGLVGQVSKALRDTALVTLLTDKDSAVTAKDNRTGAIGIVQHSQGPDDLVVTAGKQSGKRLSSFYPRGIPIGQVTRVGQTDVDSFQEVQVMPFVDFTSLDYVLVLVRPKMP